MAEFKLGRIRFVWKSNWSPEETYYKDDVVVIGGKAYICVIGHTSDADFFTDLEVTPTKWNLIADGQSWQGEWQPDTSYIVGNIVRWGGKLFIANTSHTSSSDSETGRDTDDANWDLFAEGLDWQGEWQPNTYYKENDFVKYGGITYVNRTAHTSAADFDQGLETDQSNWEVFNEGFDYKDDWTELFRYKKNDVVKRGAKLWISTQSHTSTTLFENDLANWEKFVEGFQFEDEWSPFKKYEKGDIVRYGGNQYIAIFDSEDEVPTQAETKWNLFSEGLKFVGDWNEDSSNVDYKIGEVVRLGGFTYRAVQDHSNQQPPNEDFWERLNSGFDWRGEWINSIEYLEGDVVRFGDNSYVAVSQHVSEDGVNSPDIADSSEFWSVIAVGSEQSVLTTTGDLVYYSGSAPVRLPIGKNGQILQVSTEGIPEWTFFGFEEDTYYVAEHGVDNPAPIYGKSIDRPWRSIRYAAQQIEQGAKNPEAKRLLELNRRFIQKEVLAYIGQQIDENNEPFDTAFDFDSEKYERDFGLLVDKLVWDVSHGGNVRTRKEAIAYVNDTSKSYIQGQEDQTIAAINYGLEVIEAVLDQVDPDVNYQTLRGDNSSRIAEQIKDPELESEEVFTEIQNLVKIITDAVEAGNDSNIPNEIELHTTIRVSTGRFFEVLPIIVPAKCVIMGDELRSTRVEARNTQNAQLTPRNDFKFSFKGLKRIEEIAGKIVDGITVSETTGNLEDQYNEWPISEVDWVAPQVEKLFRSIRRQIDFSIGDKVEAEFPRYYDMSSPNFGRGRDLLQFNREFFKAEVVAYIAEEYPELQYSKTKCKQDVGFIIDAVSYDLTFGGNWQSVIAGDAYYEGATGPLVFSAEEKNPTLDAYNFLNNLARDVATDTEVVPLQNNVQQIQGVGGDAAVSTKINQLFTDITDIIENGAETVAVTFPTISGTEEQAVETALDNAKSTIQSDTINFINANFPDLDYNQAKCSRDVGLIIDAAIYDQGLGTNFASIVAAYAYLRKAGRKVLEEQKEASLAAFEFARTQTVAAVPAGSEYDYARESVNMTYEWIGDIIFGGSAEGNTDQVEDQEVYNAVLQLDLNKEFIVAEILAFVDEFYQDTVTAIDTDTNILTISTTEWLTTNMPILFTDDSTDVVDAGLEEDTVYYVNDIISDTEFTIREQINGNELDITQAWNGSFTVKAAYNFNENLCARDVREYVDAVKWDLTWPAKWQRTYTNGIELYRPASYKHRLAARYYANSVVGSQEEDMFYLRNATGLRLFTVAGLHGDLGSENEFGTRRPTAGAYASLDPGWGPNDERVWILTRSPYVQNLTTFGTAAIGQKIDGDLHNGGNDSIVSNDFTQVISDGIGAWITNNGRAELVSVFSYYAHIGYLAETGGRIRATNGNNSYGTFGSVAEGVDPEEIPITAVVDNRTQFNATITNVNTDGDTVLSLEFEHAGNNYTEADISIFGPGIGAETSVDEFRDDAVFQARITEQEIGEAGGEGFTFVSNTAQEGSLTGIFLAATDGNLSSAYPGMAIYLISGVGRGQYGFIDAYNAGSKEATVVKEDGSPGWEHVVPGTEIVSPNSSTTYQIEPRVQIDAPTRVSNNSTLTASVQLAALEYFETSAEYTGIQPSTSGDGTGAEFDVTRIGSKYYVAIAENGEGTGYARLDTLTITGDLVGGDDPDHDIEILILSIGENGEILEFEFTGVGKKGKFVGFDSVSSDTAHVSDSGDTWGVATLADEKTWSDAASGLLDDGSSLLKPSAIVAIAEDGTANYSQDAETWQSSATGLTGTSNKSVAFGNAGIANDRFVVIDENSQDVAYSANGGITWTVVSNALPATGYSCITYGKGIWVAARSGQAEVSFSEDGETWTTTTNVETAAPWVDVEWGNGRFVLIASNGVVAYSLDGSEWKDSDDTLVNPEQIAYGQGMFAVTSSTETETIYYSQFGLEWSSLSITEASGGLGAIAHGNPERETKFVATGATSGNLVRIASIGAQALARAGVANEKIFEIRLKEPGSGYDSEPNITITDPSNIENVQTTLRIGKGSLANPTFLDRGTGYTEGSAEVVDENSNGEADFFQATDLIAVKRLSSRPVDGSNVEFSTLPGKFFKLVNTLSFLGTNDGSYTAFLQISPRLEIEEAPDNETEIELRIRFSQVRLTGHDFLDIGTGNFEDTNYPNTPANLPEAENETVESNGGRVFYTSTDQDGNFRVGNLFSVEQSTGIATISADAFNLAGLQELSLGEVTLGGSSATINEFSTDPFFTANSDNVVPTQRAVKAFIESQIGQGGASLNVNSVTAGDIFVGGNQITSVSGEPINIKGTVFYRRTVQGLPLAFHYFLR